MRNVPSHRVGCDEMWSFAYAKGRNKANVMGGLDGVVGTSTHLGIDADRPRTGARLHRACSWSRWVSPTTTRAQSGTATPHTSPWPCWSTSSRYHRTRATRSSTCAKAKDLAGMRLRLDLGMFGGTGITHRDNVPLRTDLGVPDCSGYDLRSQHWPMARFLYGESGGACKAGRCRGIENAHTIGFQ